MPLPFPPTSVVVTTPPSTIPLGETSVLSWEWYPIGAQEQSEIEALVGGFANTTIVTISDIDINLRTATITAIGYGNVDIYVTSTAPEVEEGVYDFDTITVSHGSTIFYIND